MSLPTISHRLSHIHCQVLALLPATEVTFVDFWHSTKIISSPRRLSAIIHKLKEEGYLQVTRQPDGTQLIKRI